MNENEQNNDENTNEETESDIDRQLAQAMADFEKSARAGVGVGPSKQQAEDSIPPEVREILGKIASAIGTENGSINVIQIPIGGGDTESGMDKTTEDQFKFATMALATCIAYEAISSDDFGARMKEIYSLRKASLEAHDANDHDTEENYLKAWSSALGELMSDAAKHRDEAFPGMFTSE